MGVGDIKRKRRYNVVPPGKAKNSERAEQESCRRAKSRIMDIVRCNDFGYMMALSLKSGVDVKTLSGALGHYSAGFTLNTYTHATAQMKQDAADTIGGVISQQMR